MVPNLNMFCEFGKCDIKSVRWMSEGVQCYGGWCGV